MTVIKKLIDHLHGVITLLVLFVNTVFWCLLLFLTAPLKLMIPNHKWRLFWSRVNDGLATNWIWVNKTVIRMTKTTEWDIQLPPGLKSRESYLVISNHQSWLDVVVLQQVFYKKIPFLKFFLKKVLIWLPFLGQAWWALDMPFMKRYSKAYLEKHPHHKGKDLEATRKACAKYKEFPGAIMNFVEGTRFTPEKAAKQDTPYKHLLKPKAAGIAFVLSAMGESLSNILNVSIVYPDKKTSLWAFMCGRIQRIKVVVQVIEISPELLGDYFEDASFRSRFQNWLNELWAEKDLMINSTPALGGAK